MTQASRPRVTVITPTYNRAALLVETIESVLNQGYPNLEYIVLDDGSQDETTTLLASYEGRIRWESHPNMGEARTVNKGFAMATGDYVIVVNSDDPILPGMIATEVAFMEAHPELLVAYPDWQVIDAESKPLREVRARDYDYANMVRWAYCMPGPGAILRRKALELVPERTAAFHYVTDLDYWLRLGLHGPLARIPEVIATHRHHGESAGVTQFRLLSSEIVQLMEQFFERPDLPPEVRRLRAEAISAACYDAGHRCAGHDYRLAVGYFWRSMRLCPKRWIIDRRIRLLSLPVFFLPPTWYSALWGGWKWLRRRTQRASDARL
jgi:glycosyltransferase involved in cell wall biosynthesis